MIISQLSTCEECRDGSCATCKRFKRRKAAFERRKAAKVPREREHNEQASEYDPLLDGQIDPSDWYGDE